MDDDFIFCYECEECDNYPFSSKWDGCEWGLKTPKDSEEENEE